LIKAFFLDTILLLILIIILGLMMKTLTRCDSQICISIIVREIFILKKDLIMKTLRTGMVIVPLPMYTLMDPIPKPS